MTGTGARLARSLFYGTLIQAFMLYLVFLTGSKSAEPWLLWNGTLADWLTGPMPVVGHSIDGGAIVEPTEVHVIMAVAGLLLGIAVYSATVHAALAAFARRRARMRS